MAVMKCMTQKWKIDIVLITNPKPNTQEITRKQANNISTQTKDYTRQIN